MTGPVPIDIMLRDARRLQNSGQRVGEDEPAYFEGNTTDTLSPGHTARLFARCLFQA